MFEKWNLACIFLILTIVLGHFFWRKGVKNIFCRRIERESQYVLLLVFFKWTDYYCCAPLLLQGWVQECQCAAVMDCENLLTKISAAYFFHFNTNPKFYDCWTFCKKWTGKLCKLIEGWETERFLRFPEQILINIEVLKYRWIPEVKIWKSILQYTTTYSILYVVAVKWTRKWRTTEHPNVDWWPCFVISYNID